MTEKSQSSSGSNDISSSLEGCSDNSFKGLDAFNLKPLSTSEWGLTIIVLKDELILWILHPWTLSSRPGTPLLSSRVIPVTSTSLKDNKHVYMYWKIEKLRVSLLSIGNTYIWKMTVGWKSVNRYFQVLPSDGRLKLPSIRVRIRNILAIRKENWLYFFCSLTSSAWYS